MASFRPQDATKRVPTERFGRAKDFDELSRAVHLGLAAAMCATKQALLNITHLAFDCVAPALWAAV